MIPSPADPLEKVAEDRAAVQSALRALWPYVRRDRLGPLSGALASLLDTLATLDRAKRAIELGLAA